MGYQLSSQSSLSYKSVNLYTFESQTKQSTSLSVTSSLAMLNTSKKMVQYSLPQEFEDVTAALQWLFSFEGLVTTHMPIP